jgi:hypothetical protein
MFRWGPDLRKGALRQMPAAGATGRGITCSVRRQTHSPQKARGLRGFVADFKGYFANTAAA